ncbi:MAG: hypothetical protein M1819_007079 [Sarea resinae]|nr:MAG: hypothetical protein M1819_007079 [Sarea resinae]
MGVCLTCFGAFSRRQANNPCPALPVVVSGTNPDQPKQPVQQEPVLSLQSDSEAPPPPSLSSPTWLPMCGISSSITPLADATWYLGVITIICTELPCSQRNRQSSETGHEFYSVWLVGKNFEAVVATSRRALAETCATATLAGHYQDYAHHFPAQSHPEDQQNQQAYDPYHRAVQRGQNPYQHQSRGIQQQGVQRPLAQAVDLDLQHQPLLLQQQSQPSPYGSSHGLPVAYGQPSKRRAHDLGLDISSLQGGGNEEEDEEDEEGGSLGTTPLNARTRRQHPGFASYQQSQPSQQSQQAPQAHHHHKLPSQGPPTKIARRGSGDLTSSPSAASVGPPSVVGQAGMPPPAPRPRGPKLKFTAEDDQLLVDLKENRSLTWKQIADFFPGRSSGTLQVRYCTKLKAKTTVWTDDMIQRLREAIQEYENDRWRLVAAKVGNGFSPAACREKATDL